MKTIFNNINFCKRENIFLCWGYLFFVAHLLHHFTEFCKWRSCFRFFIPTGPHDVISTQQGKLKHIMQCKSFCLNLGEFEKLFLCPLKQKLHVFFWGGVLSFPFLPPLIISAVLRISFSCRNTKVLSSINVWIEILIGYYAVRGHC